MRTFLLGLVLFVATGCSPASSSPSASHRSPAIVAPTTSLGAAESPSPSQTPAATPIRSSAIASPTSEPPDMAPVDEPPQRLYFRVGTLLATVTDRLRVRSAPSTEDHSRRYEPLLPIGTMLHAIEGPVAGSGYWWYRVELTDRQTLFDGVRVGWVAAADHDGSPWIDVHRDITPGPTFPPVKTGWPSVQHGDVSLWGDSVQPASHGAIEIPVEIRGRLPGSVETLTASVDYWHDWYCGGGPMGELGRGVTWLTHQAGTAAIETDVTIDHDGVGRATVHLPAAQPTDDCPADHPGPVFTMAGGWSDVHVTAPSFGLRLSPPGDEWADTI